MTYQYPDPTTLDFSWSGTDSYAYKSTDLNFKWTYEAYQGEIISWEGLSDYLYPADNLNDIAVWDIQGYLTLPTVLGDPSFIGVEDYVIKGFTNLVTPLGIPDFLSQTEQIYIQLVLESVLRPPTIQTVNTTEYLPPERDAVTLEFFSTDTYVPDERNVVVVEFGTPYSSTNTWLSLNTPLQIPSVASQIFAKSFLELPSPIAYPNSVPQAEGTTTKYDVGYYPSSDFYFNEVYYSVSTDYNFELIELDFNLAPGDVTSDIEVSAVQLRKFFVNVPSVLYSAPLNVYALTGTTETDYTPGYVFSFTGSTYNPSQNFFFDYAVFNFYQNYIDEGSSFTFGDGYLAASNALLDDAIFSGGGYTVESRRDIALLTQTEDVISDISLDFSVEFFGELLSVVDESTLEGVGTFIDPVEGFLISSTDDSTLDGTGIAPIAIDATWDSGVDDSVSEITISIIACEYIFPSLDGLHFIWTSKPTIDETDPANYNLTWFEFCNQSTNIIDSYTAPVVSDISLNFSPAVFVTMDLVPGEFVSDITLYFIAPRDATLDVTLDSPVSDITLLTPIALYVTWDITTTDSTFVGSGIVPLRIDGTWSSSTANSNLFGLGEVAEPPLATIDVTLDDAAVDFQLLREIAFTLYFETDPVFAEFESSNSSAQISSTLEDVYSVIQVIHLFGSLESYLANIIPYIRFYQLSFIWNSTTDNVSASFVAKTPIPIDVTLDGYTGEPTGDILLDYITPILIQMDLITSDAIWRTLKPISRTFGDFYSLNNLTDVVNRKSSLYSLQSLHVTSLQQSELVTVFGKHITAIPSDVIQSVLAKTPQAIKSDTFYTVNRLPATISHLLDEFYSASSKLGSSVVTQDVYRILYKEAASLQKLSINSVITKSDVSRFIQNLNSIKSKVDASVNIDSIYKLNAFIDKELSFINQSTLEVAKEHDVEFIQTSTVDSFNEVEIEFLFSYSIVKEREVEIELLQVYDVHQAKVFESFVNVEYELNSAEQRVTNFALAHFGNARNPVNNEVRLEYIADFSNSFESVHTIEHNLVLTRWEFYTHLQNRIIAASQEFLDTYHRYGAVAKTKELFKVITSDIKAISEHSSVNQEYANVYKELQDFVQSNFARFYKEFEQSTPLSSNLDVFYDAGGILHNINYEIEAPTEGVMIAETDDISGIIRLLTKLAVIIDVTLDDVNSLLRLEVAEFVYVDLDTTLQNVSSSFLGYATLKLYINAKTPDCYSNFLIYTFIGSWASNTGSCSANIKGYAPIQGTISADLTHYDYGVEDNPLADFRLTTVTSVDGSWASTLSSITFDFLGLGHSVVSLLTQTEDVSSFFPLSHPYGLKIDAFTSNTTSAFKLIIPESREGTLEATLANVSRSFTGYSAIRGALHRTLDNITLVSDIRFSIFKSYIEAVTKTITVDVELFTITRTFVSFNVNPDDATGEVIARIESQGRMLAETESPTSFFYGSHVTGTLSTTTSLSLEIQLRFPVMTTIDGDTGEDTFGDIYLKTPINIFGLFYNVTDAALGGFRMRAPISGSFHVTTPFVTPSFIFPSNVGEWHSYTHTQLESNIYMVNRDEQIILVDAVTEEVESKFKGYTEIGVHITAQLKNDYSVAWGKVPTPYPFKMLLQADEPVVEVRLHTSKAFLIVIEKTMTDAEGGIFLYHPVSGNISSKLEDIVLDLELQTPIRYNIDFTPHLDFALSDVQLAVPTYGIVRADIGSDFGYFQALTYYGAMRPTLPGISLNLRLFTITKTEGTLEFVVDDSTSICIGKVDVAGRLKITTGSTTGSFTLHTPILAPSRSGTLQSTLSTVVSKIFLDNPTNGLRIEGYTDLISDIRLASLVQGTFDVVAKDAKVKEWELFNGSKTGTLESELESAESNFRGYIKVLGFFTRTLSKISMDFTITTSPARTGNMVASTHNNTGLIVVKSIQDQVAGVLSRTLDNVKFIYIYGKVPYRYFSTIEATLNDAAYNSEMYVAPGGRMATETAKVFPIIILSDIHLGIYADTGSIEADIEFGTPGSFSGILRRLLDDATLTGRCATNVVGHLNFVTAEPSLVRFRFNKELYGKMVPWDYIVGDLPPRFEYELDIDPIYDGWRSIPNALDPRVCDLFKRTDYVRCNIRLYTPIVFEATIRAYTTGVKVVHLNGYSFGAPGVTFAALGNVELWGRMSPDPLAEVFLLMRGYIERFTLTMKRTLQDVETDITLRHARGFQIILEFQTKPVACSIGAKAINPGFMLTYPDDAIANFYMNVPFFVYGDIETSTGNVGMTRFIGEVVEYKWAFWMSGLDHAIGDIPMRIGIGTKEFFIVTSNAVADFRGEIKFNLGTLKSRLASSFAYIEGEVAGFSQCVGYISPTTAKTTALITLETSLSIKMATSTANVVPNISMVVATPKFVDFYFMPDKAVADFKGWIEVLVTVDKTLPDAVAELELYYIPPRFVYVDLWFEDAILSGTGVITVYVTVDTFTEDVTSVIDLRFMSFAVIDVTTESVSIDSLIYIYKFSKERVSDTYYTIEGDIIPDTSSKLADTKGYVRVYDGKTGELLFVEYTENLTYKINNVVEGEYTVVYDPNSQRRLKVHSKIILGD